MSKKHWHIHGGGGDPSIDSCEPILYELKFNTFSYYLTRLRNYILFVEVHILL